MVGWLVVNSFIQSQKAQTMREFFCASAVRHGVELVVKRSDELVGDICGGINNKPDFCIFWDKDIYLARRLENAGIRLFNSAQAVHTCDNKILTAFALRGVVDQPLTIAVPKTYENIGYTSFDYLHSAAEILSFPLVIKEAYGSFGMQVHLARNFDEAAEILKRIGSRDCLLQEFIACSSGRDVRINVVGGKVFASMLRTNTCDFRSNISGGGTTEPYTPTAAQCEAAVKACAASGLDFGGVDVLFGEDGPIVCEVNSNPHFKSLYDCTGDDMSDEIIKHIVKEMR